MRKALLMIWAVTLVAATAGARPAPGVFYVAPDGDDGAPGTCERPFASLQRAFDAVGQGDTIRLKSGIYVLSGPLDLHDANGIVVEACAGGEPVFRGSTAIRGWKRVRDRKVLGRVAPQARKSLWWTDLGAQGITDWGDPVKERKRPVLYCDGQEQMLARYPNEGFAYGGRALGPTPIPPVENGNSGTVEGIFEYMDATIDRWAEEQDPWACGYWFYDWTDACRAITRIDAAHRVMEVRGGRSFRHGLRFFGLNLLCEIDAPGEWYLDRSDGRLYWYAPEGVDPNRVGMTLSTLGARYMLQVRDCEDVALRGLGLRESRGGGIRISGGRDVRIEGCTLENLGAAAIVVDGGERHRIEGCALRHLATSGITMRGGDRARLIRAGHVCANTLVEDYERFSRTYNGAFTAEGCGITLHHCVLRDGPSSALSLAGNDLVAEYNVIEEVAKESDDQGGFDLYLNPSMRGIVMRYNLWRNIRSGTRYGVAGIRLDDLISGVQIYGNVFDRCGSIEFGGIQIHGGSENVIEDNVFYDCPYAVSFTPYGDSLWHATWDRIRDRIRSQVDMDSEDFLIRYPETRQLGRRIDVNVVRNNLLVDCGSLYFRATVPQIEANNVSVPSEGRTLADFCRPEVLDPLGIRRIPLDEILSTPWL
ncbi:MAG: right-handed parallel beta-helix repeat-containing protein [Bacteroidales bacterium]|nr:right-handed parallel beta-helix repeat-containing protein [Bacteroidales bacterium]